MLIYVRNLNFYVFITIEDIGIFTSLNLGYAKLCQAVLSFFDPQNLMVMCQKISTW